MAERMPAINKTRLREGRCSMKRFSMTVACVGLFAFGALSASQAGPLGASNVTKAKAANTPRLTRADLAVTQFQGVLQGSNYVLGGSVKNLGPGDYSRTFDLNKGFQGRRLQVFVIINGGLGKGGSSKLLRSILVPNIKSGQTWTTPTITIPASQVPGPATAQFLLMLTSGDNNSANDWRQTSVNSVR
jgi:hypothetical protein